MTYRYLLLLTCFHGGLTAVAHAQPATSAAAGDTAQANPGTRQTPADDTDDTPAAPEDPADEQSDSDEDEDTDVNPWARGVSAEDQAAATEKFLRGNKAFDRANFGGAEKAYLAALFHWNHPAIQYNLALALIGKKGEDPVRIYKALEQAVRFGEEPLGTDRYQQALREEKEYRAQLATLELRCDEPDTLVILDGRNVLTGPGHFKDYVPVGEHLISATKTGYIAINKTVDLESEETFKLDLVMYTLADRTRYERRFSVWMPWTAASSGVAVLAISATLNYLSLQNHQDYLDKVDSECQSGCPPGFNQSLKQRAEAQQLSAYIGYGVGSAAVAVGTVLVFLNQPKKIVEIDDDAHVAPTKRTVLVPVIAPNIVGVRAIINF